MPFELVRTGDNPILIAYSRVGGHASFMTGTFKPVSWYPTPVAEFFDFMEDKLRNTGQSAN